MTNGLVTLRSDTINLWNVQWAWEEVDDCVQKLLNTLVFVSRANKDRVNLTSKNASTKSALKGLNVNLFTLENSHHNVLREVRCCLKKLFTLLSCNLYKLCWNLVEWLRVNHALCILFKVPCSVGDKVDKTPEVGLSAHWDLSCNCVCAKAVTHSLDCTEEVCAYAVKLVDECNTRYAVLGCLTPNGL